MSKYKEQRLRQIENDQRQQTRLRRWVVTVAVIVALSAGAAFWHRHAHAPKANATSSATSTDEKRTLAALLALKPRQIEELDIGLTNLLCAEGLRGSEDLDLDKALDRLDEMAIRVRLETDRNMHRFRAAPAEYENSEAYFQMLMLVTVLQQDFGIRYNPDRVTPVGVFEPNEKFYADSRDVFIHGLTGETKSGTCASLPPLCIAVGRRLKYPLHLVSAKCHLFLRWEDQRTRLNIDVSGLGTNSHDDDYYRTWPYPMTPKEEKEVGYLKNMTAAEECAVFLSTRGHCLRAAGRFDEALAAHEQSCRILPDARIYQIILDIARREDAARKVPALPGIGMPPDPSLWDLPPETAWMLWNGDQARRQHEELGREVPTPTPGIPSPIQPLGRKTSSLPPPPRNR